MSDDEGCSGGGSIVLGMGATHGSGKQGQVGSAYGRALTHTTRNHPNRGRPGGPKGACPLGNTRQIKEERVEYVRSTHR